MRYLLVVAVVLAGCASAAPPEMDHLRAGVRGGPGGSGDPEYVACTKGDRAAALAACPRVIARPDPTAMPGSVGAVVPRVVYELRAQAAIQWARQLRAAGAAETEVEGALGHAVRFYERAFALAPGDRALEARLAWLKRVLARPVDLTRT